MTPPLDLGTVYDRVRQGTPRDDCDLLHASDLTACHYATWLRINGTDELPMPETSLDKFVIGHAMEQYVAGFLAEYAREQGLVVTHGRRVESSGIVGHLDFDLCDAEGQIVAVIDATTTSFKTAEAKWSHTVKTAWYASVVGAPMFCEWVFRLGFGGVIAEAVPFWFATADYADELAALETRLLAIRESQPAMVPPDGLGYNPCGVLGSGKSYCQARCVRNAALSEDERAGLELAS